MSGLPGRSQELGTAPLSHATPGEQSDTLNHLSLLWSNIRGEVKRQPNEIFSCCSLIFATVQPTVLSNYLIVSYANRPFQYNPPFITLIFGIWLVCYQAFIEEEDKKRKVTKTFQPAWLDS